MSKFKDVPYSQVEGHDKLIRDNYSKAIINTDEHALQLHRKNRRALKERVRLLSELNSSQQDKINKLEKEVENLKTLVYDFLEK